MNIEIIIGVVLVVLAFYIYKHRAAKDVDIPPAPQRTDLLYGYYGCMDDQVSRVSSHTNLHWESQFQGMIKACKNILEAKTFTVLDVSPQIMFKFAETGRNYRLHENAQSNLVNMLHFMQTEGALQYVKAICIMDEPNTNVKDAEEFQRAIDLVKSVVYYFPELKDVKYIVIYAAQPRTYDCLYSFHYVGVDDYDKKSQIFVDSTYDDLLMRLHPEQKTVIMPGGAFGQDPTPFLNFANQSPEVGMIVPFTWLGPMQERDMWVGIGESSNTMQQKYIETGLKVISHD
jgi:hypothetical protein